MVMLLTLGLGLEQIIHKSIKLSNSLLAQLTPLGGLKMLPRPQFSNAHSLNYLIKKIIYIYMCVCVCVCVCVKTFVIIIE